MAGTSESVAALTLALMEFVLLTRALWLAAHMRPEKVRKDASATSDLGIIQDIGTPREARIHRPLRRQEVGHPTGLGQAPLYP